MYKLNLIIFSIIKFAFLTTGVNGSDFLKYPTDIETPLTGRTENFYEPVDKLNISINNLSSLNVSRGEYKHELSILEHFWQKGHGVQINDENVSSQDISFMVPKNEIEFVEMSEMKILKPNNIYNKSSLVTLHVYPCVAIAVYNKANKYIGLAHIPGSPIDRQLESAKDPLESYWENTSRQRIKEDLLERSITKFLNIMTADSSKEDLTFHLFGGHFNRLLLVQVINLINQNGYSINIENIHHGRDLTSSERTFSPHAQSTVFNIEINSKGNVFVLKNRHDIEIKETLDKGLLEEVRKKVVTSMASDLLTSIAYEAIPTFLSSEHSKRANQFEKIYFKELGEEIAPTTFITNTSEEKAEDAYTYYSPILNELSRIQEVSERIDLIHKILAIDPQLLKSLSSIDSTLTLNTITQSLDFIFGNIMKEEKKQFFDSPPIQGFRNLYNPTYYWINGLIQLQNNAGEQMDYNWMLSLNNHYINYISPFLQLPKHTPYNISIIGKIEDERNLTKGENINTDIQERLHILKGLVLFSQGAIKNKASKILLTIVQDTTCQISDRLEALQTIRDTYNDNLINSANILIINDSTFSLKERFLAAGAIERDSNSFNLIQFYNDIALDKNVASVHRLRAAHRLKELSEEGEKKAHLVYISILENSDYVFSPTL